MSILMMPPTWAALTMTVATVNSTVGGRWRRAWTPKSRLRS